MTKLDRRHFLMGLGGTALAPTIFPTIFPTTARALGDHPGDSDPGPVFRHGVASGDPLNRRVILWTRITPPVRIPSVKVVCTVFSDPYLLKPIRRIRVRTGPWRDYTVKIDVAGLRPGTTYYYKFESLYEASPIGRTRTLPNGRPDHFRMAVASCSNYPAGYFSGYRKIAEREDLDLVLHLGDYLYEYADGTFGSGAALGREPSPNAEILALADYRERHAQYKSDVDLQEAHRQHPFITVWDDHETANNAWVGGAENHQADEGDWHFRKLAARRAYFEWMPIRDRRGFFERRGRIYRGFRAGDLVQLDMIDTRLFGREEQLPGIVDPISGTLLVDPSEIPAILASLSEPGRQLLGSKQEEWLLRRLEREQRRRPQWNVIGQQVMMGQIQTLLPGTDLRIPVNMDQWDGYPAARAKLLATSSGSDHENLVVLTGDIHSSWTHDLTPNPFDPASYDPTTGDGSAGVEFVTPGITSPSGIPPAIAGALEAQILSTAPHTKYVNLTQRGYLVLDIDRNRARSEWYHLDDVTDPSSGERFARAAETATGSRRVEVVGGGALAARPGSPAPALEEVPTKRIFA